MYMYIFSDDKYICETKFIYEYEIFALNCVDVQIFRQTNILHRAQLKVQASAIANAHFILVVYRHSHAPVNWNPYSTTPLAIISKRLAKE